MALQERPSNLPVWAEAGDKVQPTNQELQIGWPLSATPPSRQRWNWVLNWLTGASRYFLQKGIPEYSSTEEYGIGSKVIGSNGKSYTCIQAGTNHNPIEADSEYWELWGFSLSELAGKAVAITGLTGSAKLPVGTTAQRDADPEDGFMRYNKTLDKPEVYSEAKATWGPVGGGATGGGTDEIFHLNGQAITQNFTIPAGKNAGTFGPVTIADGVTVTIEDGANWTIT